MFHSQPLHFNSNIKQEPSQRTLVLRFSRTKFYSLSHFNFVHEKAKGKEKSCVKIFLSQFFIRRFRCRLLSATRATFFAFIFLSSIQFYDSHAVKNPKRKWRKSKKGLRKSSRFGLRRVFPELWIKIKL
jgi:hypothetical protein